KFNRLSMDGARASEFEAATMNLATAYGLAIQGLGFKHGVMANLVPVAVVREQVWKRKTRWFAAAAVLSVVGGAIAFYRPVVDRASNPANNKPPVIQATVGEITKLRGEWNEAQKKFVPDFRAANVAMLVERRDAHAYLLRDL